MAEKTVYLDHAATTPLKKEVLDEMMPFLTINYGNPSSVYSAGRTSKNAIEDARERVAKAINANINEIFFTSGGTESDNWAIRGAAYANKDKGKHIITSLIEHHAVLNTCRQLEKEGFEVTYLAPDEFGIIHEKLVEDAIRKDTILISIMFANNEIGTIQPIEGIGKIAKEKGIIFHTDAVQAIGNIPVDIKELYVDLLSISGHKFYGPKGVGVLYVKKGTKLQNYILGGAQERNKRAGTENVAGIAGIGKAIELASERLEDYEKHTRMLRDKTIEYIINNIPYVKLNGTIEKRLPGNVNIAFQFIEAESAIIMLDCKGIAASSGSACASGSLDPSHVLLAIGLPHEIAHGSLRFSFGEENTVEDIDWFLGVLKEVMIKLRTMSPLYNSLMKNQ
ncbi:MAG: cysteine desulfurase NifS [Peptostreptococcaceae bacterium]|nr:cysteine desulfurase NifS [Peptostreptococcaceae bacterium]